MKGITKSILLTALIATSAAQASWYNPMTWGMPSITLSNKAKTAIAVAALLCANIYYFMYKKSAPKTHARVLSLQEMYAVCTQPAFTISNKEFVSIDMITGISTYTEPTLQFSGTTQIEYLQYINKLNLNDTTQIRVDFYLVNPSDSAMKCNILTYKLTNLDNACKALNQALMHGVRLPQSH